MLIKAERKSNKIIKSLASNQVMRQNKTNL